MPKTFKKRILIFVGLFLIPLNTITAITAFAENFTIIVLPDTQNYASWYPDTFSTQTQWIVDNRENLNIVYVAHVGDIVNIAGSEIEWKSASASMSLLEDPIATGMEDGIPYGVVPGNHDKPTTAPGYYNTYFGISRFSGRSYYGDTFDSDNDDNYTLFSAGGMNFIVINLNYGRPDTAILNWAESLLKTYSERRAIVVSHYLLDIDGNFSIQGQKTYDALKNNSNLFLMLCGHRHGEALREEEHNGSTVNILLANYQTLPNGGDGWLRILEFSPAKDEITIKTYSPLLNKCGTDTVMGNDTTFQEFTISYNMVAPTHTREGGGGSAGCFIAITAYE
jgi:hypothetical protein